MEETHYTPEQLHQLPAAPGVYHFYDASHTLIYVGKAKNIKKRVASYFNRLSNIGIKTRKMVTKIKSLSFILVNNEYEALLLENNLIKQKQPRYNILLKDGKTYPYLCLTHEPFPRLLFTRQRTPSLGTYFGPFTNNVQLQEIQELIRALYPLRTCRYDLSAGNIAKKKFKVCLEYHIGNCKGPCEGKESEATYQTYIDQVQYLLKGNFQQVKKELKAKAEALAKAERFLEAHAYKKKLDAIAQYQAKSLVIHPSFGNLDVIAIHAEEAYAFIHYFYIQKGSIIFSQTLHIKKKLTESKEELLSTALAHFRQAAQSHAKEILAPFDFGPIPEGTRIVIPQQGDKQKILALALKNLFFFQKNYLKEKEVKVPPSRRLLLRAQQDLRLKNIPMHIECFDNSNLQGTAPVAAMVVFKKGRPAKKDYRHFHVKSVQGPDDFASMREIVFRHYKRQIEENAPLPDLILIDGGKGQLSAAWDALTALDIHHQVELLSIAKKLELIYRPHDPHPLYINKTSPSLKLLQQIRDEAHRFAITFHRQIRTKQSLQSSLHAIPHIGPKTFEKLLQHFGSVAQIKKTALGKLVETIGKQKAQHVFDFFQQEENK